MKVLDNDFEVNNLLAASINAFSSTEVKCFPFVDENGDRLIQSYSATIPVSHSDESFDEVVTQKLSTVFTGEALRCDSTRSHTEVVLVASLIHEEIAGKFKKKSTDIVEIENIEYEIIEDDDGDQILFRAFGCW